MPEGEFEETYPYAFTHLCGNKDKLSKRIWFGKSAEELSGKWYGVMYLEPSHSFEVPHLLTPSLSDRSNFTLGFGDLFVTGTAGVTSIIPLTSNKENLLYLLGLLNSSLISTYAINHSPIYAGGYYKFSAPYLKQLPIRRINFSNSADVALHDTVVAYVETLLDLHRRRREVTEHTDAWEEIGRQIGVEDAALDRLVYELYGLTEEEIAIVEG